MQPIHVEGTCRFTNHNHADSMVQKRLQGISNSNPNGLFWFVWIGSRICGWRFGLLGQCAQRLTHPIWCWGYRIQNPKLHMYLERNLLEANWYNKLVEIN
jgi:hypothetical protein